MVLQALERMQGPRSAIIRAHPEDITLLEQQCHQHAELEAYRKAFAVHPHLKGVAEHVRSLTDKVEGRDI